MKNFTVENSHQFKEGDCIMGKWSDSTYYPCTVISLNPNGHYLVEFYDGFRKKLTNNQERVKKYSFHLNFVVSVNLILIFL